MTTMDFSAYGRPLEIVNSFKYLGRMILVTDEKWPTVVSNMAREKKVWGIMSRILSREGVTPWVSGLFFKVLIQAALIFREET